MRAIRGFRHSFIEQIPEIHGSKLQNNKTKVFQEIFCLLCSQFQFQQQQQQQNILLSPSRQMPFVVVVVLYFILKIK